MRNAHLAREYLDPMSEEMASEPAPRRPGALMRAARFHRLGEPFSIDRVATPQPRPTEVLIEIKATGIVPNFLNVLKLLAVEQPYLQFPTPPAIFGLDPTGVVAGKGELVHGFEIGDRVYANPLRYCGGCRACRMGKVRACAYVTLNGYFGVGEKSRQTFVDHPAGGYAEYMTAPQYSLVKLPDNLSFEAAARWGYLGTSYAALRRAQVDTSTTVLVNGASGTLGLGAVLFALAIGAPRILGVGRNRELLARVKALAPDRIEVLSTEDGLVTADWARSLTSGVGADVVLDALPTGAPAEALLSGLAALAPSGIHVNVGGVRGPVPVDLMDAMNKNQSLLGSFWFTTKQGQEMADLAGSGLLKLDCLRHELFPLERIDDGVRAIDSRTGGFSNLVVVP